MVRFAVRQGTDMMAQRRPVAVARFLTDTDSILAGGAVPRRAGLFDHSDHELVYVRGQSIEGPQGWLHHDRIGR